MEKYARKLIVYSLAGILLSGVGAATVQAAPYDRDDRQSETRHERRSDNNGDVRRHEFTHERYSAPHWKESARFEHRQPWEWRSRDHAGRRFISDARWNREFPGLRSYRWNGPGFWYDGYEYRDLVMFYDDGDTLVSVGFWNRGQFIMVRDDDRSYYNHNPFVARYRHRGFGINIRL